MTPATEKICQGIILGLHRVEDTNHDGILGWAPDFPAEGAAYGMSTLLALYPQYQRRTAGNRIVEAVEEHAEDWVEMLCRVVYRAASAKPRGRR